MVKKREEKEYLNTGCSRGNEQKKTEYFHHRFKHLK
jgi:hypothetical protein